MPANRLRVNRYDFHNTLLDVENFLKCTVNCVLIPSGNYKHVEIITGNTCKKLINYRSSRRNRTYSCAIPVHCSDHALSYEVADGSKRIIDVYLAVVVPANGLRVNHYDFMALHSMWRIF